MPRRGLLHILQGHLAPPPHNGGEAAVRESAQLLVERAAATSAGAPLRRVQQLCGPLNHNGHIVADIHEAMDDWVSCGVGPWFYNGEREERWLKQEADGGGRVGKLRPTQLYYGEPTAYRALVATAYTGDLMVELVQPFNDEPSPHNDWLRGGGPHGDAPRGNGIQHICWIATPDIYVEAVNVCLDAGWVPSIQLIEGSGKPGSGPPGAPDMPTVHYFDCMEIFGFHVEIAMNSAGRDDRGRRWSKHLAATWDGSTDPIRVSAGPIPDDYE